MSEKRKNNCQNPYNVCYDNYLNTNACTECTGLISTPAKDNEEWENYRKIFDFIPDPSDESKKSSPLINNYAARFFHCIWQEQCSNE